MVTVAQAQAMLHVGVPGRVRLWPQRLEPRPYLNCRFWSWLSQAWWGGLRWDRKDALAITELLRRRSGRLEFIDGVPQGTSSADLERAIRATFPWMRTVFRIVGDGELRHGLNVGRWTAGVGVWLPDLPAEQQRWAGSSAVGHQVALMGARDADVLELDPLGIAPYDGDWVRWRSLTPALLQRTGDATFCTLVEKGDHMLTTVTVVRAFVDGKAEVAKGKLQTYKVRGDDFDRVADVDMPRTTVSVAYVAQVEKRPVRAPIGRFAYIIDGPAEGRFVRVGDLVDLRDVVTPDSDAAYQRGLLDGRAEVEAQLVEVDTPLYERLP